jgi:hypothetical protein
LVFRYDSALHFPDLPSFPHHKHLRASTVESVGPESSDVLAEARREAG